MNLFVRLNRLLIFDPARWPHRERVSRCVALVMVALFFVLRIADFDQFPQTYGAARRHYADLQAAGAAFPPLVLIWGGKLALWLVETAIFIGYIASYASRSKALAIAKGVMETAFPIAVAGLPVIMAMAPNHLVFQLPLASPWYWALYLAILGLMIVGGIINLVGLFTLRRAFTIMVEARTMITHGLFGHVRHPLYMGHLIMFFASLLLRWHWYTLILYLAFCVGQVVRARSEERKLMQTFQEYEAYRRHTGMFFPRLGVCKSTQLDP